MSNTRIAEIAEALGFTEDSLSKDARYNLEGALQDLRASKNDEVVQSTIRRVIRQLAKVERLLADEEVSHD
jgi:type VI protein secretion system component VasF